LPALIKASQRNLIGLFLFGNKRHKNIAEFRIASAGIRFPTPIISDVLLSLFAHVLVPLFALVAVAAIEFEKGAPMALQAAEAGTDLCILAIGATGSVLINPGLLAKFGPEWMVLISILVVLATVTLAGVSIHVKRSAMNPSGRAKLNVALGFLAVTLVSSIVVWGVR
jgi:hypothetical protein